MSFVVVVVVAVVGVVCVMTPPSSTISSHIPSRKWVMLARCTVSHLKHTRDKLRKQQQQKKNQQQPTKSIKMIFNAQQ
jgi:adenylate kinase